MISSEWTFSYIFKVPGNTRLPMAGRVWDRFGHEHERSRCLVGPTPVLVWEEHTPEAWKLYARVTLTAVETRRATVAGIAFTLERGLLTMLRPRDVLHVYGDPMIGLSILRDSQLIAAAGSGGALSYIPTGEDVDIGIPGDLISQSEAIFRTRDPNYRMIERPVQITIGGETRIMRWGRPKMGPFEVFVVPSGRDKYPRVSLERIGVCPETAAHTSAELLDREPYQVIGGRTRS